MLIFIVTVIILFAVYNSMGFRDLPVWLPNKSTIDFSPFY